MQDLGYSVAKSIRSYKDLIVWQKSVDLTEEVYKISALYPKEEIFGLVSQVRRAACSITLNIAEGYGRNTTKNYVNSLYVAKGSAQEVEAAIILSVRLGFVTSEKCEKANALLLEEFKMLNSLINTLEEKIKN